MKSEILIWLCGVKELTSRGSCAYRLLVLHLPNAQVLQWDNSSGFFVLHKKKKQPKMTECSAHRKQQIFTVTVKLSHTHCGVLKVVQTVVCEDEPSPLPGFYSSPCGANSQHQRGSARKTQRERETSTEAPGRAADRQTDVWADRQMTAPEDSFSHNIPLFALIHHCTTSRHTLTITFTCWGVLLLSLIWRFKELFLHQNVYNRSWTLSS